MIDHNNLEEFADPDDYDLQDTSETGVAFYTALALETGPPILEIACGTGRVSIPIARLGLAVTGLDIVPGMLEWARRKSAGLPIHSTGSVQARWVEGDARSFDLGEQFRLIFLTGNAFQAFLTRSDQEALLERVRVHLHEEGLFAFETRNPRWAGQPPSIPPQRGEAERGEGLFTFLESRTEEEEGQSYIDSNGREVRVSRTQVYDHVAQILHWTSYRRWSDPQASIPPQRGESTKITRIAVRFTFPQELEALLHYNGFSLIRRYGDWNLEPLSAASPSIIVVCRRTHLRARTMQAA